MDSRTKASPLLSQRPEFLGVGWGREGANIFVELFHISFIYPFISSPTFSYNRHAYVSGLNSEDQIQDDTVKMDAVAAEINDASKRERQTHETKHSERSVDLRRKENHCHGGENNNFDFKDETKQIFNIFRKLKIPFETEVYRPKEDRLHVDKNIFYCKNLFLKDRKGHFYLIIFHEDTEMNIKQLRKTLNAYRNFNFATAEDMVRILHCEPGGVAPLALKYESAREVTMVVSESLVHDEAHLMFHPMDANLATKISLPCLLRFLKHFGHIVQFIE